MLNREMMKQAQRFQARLAEVQEALTKETVEASAGGGVVKVVVDGAQRMRSVHIAPEAVDPDDVAMLEDLILAATNEALEQAKELAASRLGAITGGLRIPGLT